MSAQTIAKISWGRSSRVVIIEGDAHPASHKEKPVIKRCPSFSRCPCPCIHNCLGYRGLPEKRIEIGNKQGKKYYWYPASIIGSGLVIVGVLFIAAPQLFTLFVTDLYAFFGQAAVTQTVMDARAWTPAEAWTSFNYGLLLMAGGMCVTLYNNYREERPQEIFAMVWALIILFSTWQHVRYEYYLAVVIALLSAVCIHFVFEKGWPNLRILASGFTSSAADGPKETDEPPRGKKQKKATTHSKGADPLFVAVMAVVFVLGLLFLCTHRFPITTRSDYPVLTR